MAKVDNSTISKTSWGDVDKTALGRRLAEKYAAGEVTKAQIREVYAFVPDEAFDKDDDGPVFERSKAWGPHHELRGDTIVVNRDGVFAAAAALAGARSEPSLSAAEIASARRHIRKHYRGMEEEMPDSLKEATIIDRGAPLEELTKGSLNYTVQAIEQAFRDEFADPEDPWELTMWVVEVFADYIIVSNPDLDVELYNKVPYSKDDDNYTFAPKDEWEIVQLTYEPKRGTEESVTIPSERDSKKCPRFVEALSGPVRLLDESDKQDGPWRIRAVGITADVVNNNGRRYPAGVLRAAVTDLKSNLQESAGQGRVLKLYGESEHPSMKATRRPFLSEVIVNWDSVTFDGRHILLEGNLLGTTSGKDIRAQMLGGITPGVSQRAYGESHIVEEAGQKVEVVDWAVITGYDLTVEPSDPAAGITMFESKTKNHTEVSKMDFEKLLESLKEEGILEGLTEAIQKRIEEAQKQKNEEQQIKMLREALDAKEGEDLVEAARRLAETNPRPGSELEKKLRKELNLSETADLDEALQERWNRLKELEEAEQKRQVSEYIEAQTKDLKYPDWMRKKMVEAIQAIAPATVDAAKDLIVSKRKEYDALMAELELRMKGRNSLDVLGPVLERETGVPAFAQVAFELSESIRKVDLRPRRDFRNPKTINEEFTALYLAKFDEQYKGHLQRELARWQEAEQVSDLDLPYSVSRAVVAEAFPRLVSSGIFDFGLTDQSPSRIYFEAYEGESGYTVSVTDEDVVSDEDAWVEMDYKRITPGTVVVEPNGGGTAFTEGTDYVIDYANGLFWTIAAGDGGTIGDGTTVDVDYDYTAIRLGEMVTIERGKVGLSYETLEVEADRLATQISHEAIVFSRAQLGWDAVSRTLNSLVRQVTRKIDQGAIYKALAAALSVASNSGGTWTAASDTYQDFVEKIGVAKVKVLNRYYDPTFVLLSGTNADKIANWDGFTQAGARPDADLNANGYMGRLKGLPVFESTEMSDSYALVGNREVVMHRVFQAMQIKGPYPTIDATTGELIAADQYYAEEYNGTAAPVPQKAAYVIVA